MSTPRGAGAVGGIFGVNRLYKVAQVKADATGNATFAFDAVTSGQVWTGSIIYQSPQPVLTTFSVFIDGKYYGQFEASGSLTGVQAADGAQVTVTTNGGLFPNLIATVVWVGSINPIGSAPITLPFVSGPVGFQTVINNGLFPLQTTAVRTDQVLANVNLVPLAAGASATVFNGSITGISYQVNVDALGVASPATPFIKVSFLWLDGNGGSVLDVQHWFPLITNVSPAASNTLVTGRGPSESPWLQVIIKNLDTSSVTYDFELLGCSVPVARHDWRNVSNNITGSYTFGGQTFTTPVSDMATLFSGNSGGLTISAGATQARINSIYAGKNQLSVTQAAAFTGQVQVYALQPEFAIPWQLVYQAPYPATTISLNVSDLALTRSPCLTVFSNTSGASGTLEYALIPEEVSS